MAETSIISLIGTGAALGVVHVLTGPDHLSALATLSANVGNCQACWLGIRWGIGHSSGLLLVGIVLILLSGNDSTIDVPDWVAHLFESLVGVFMLLLGIYGVRRAWLKRTDNKDEEGGSRHHHHQDQPLGFQFDGEADPTCVTAPSEFAGGMILAQSSSEEADAAVVGDGETDTTCVASPSEFAGVMILAQSSSEEAEAVVVRVGVLEAMGVSQWRACLDRITRRLSTRFLAFGIGVIHGLAGPGGVLGVIPAVQLKDWRLATIYLSCFCVASTVTMGCFAAIYGSCSAHLVGNSGSAVWREFLIECFSASLSILVGITWLTLLWFGKLEDVFP